MTALRYCTFAGIDERTNVKDMMRLARKYPFVEWAIFLDSRKNKNGEGRFPRLEWISKFKKETSNHLVRTAIHLFGDDARKFIQGDDKIVELCSNFGRVQLNFTASKLQPAPGVTLDKFQREIHYYTNSLGLGRIILPYYQKNVELINAMGMDSSIDHLTEATTSTGHNQWPRLDEFNAMGKSWGYTGGINIDNIKEQLMAMRIASVGKPFWINIEGSIRNERDECDLHKCEAIAKACAGFIFDDLIAKGNVHSLSDEAFPTSIEDLNEISLSWWCGLASGYTMNIPPANAASATYFGRTQGKFYSFKPTSCNNDFSDCIDGTKIGCIFKDNQWHSIDADNEMIPATSRQDAMLKGLVHSVFGASLPKNIATNEKFMDFWIGSESKNLLSNHLGKDRSNLLRPETRFSIQVAN